MAQGARIRKYEAVLLGGSAGSLHPIMGLLPGLRSDLKLAVIIIMHRNNIADDLLTGILAPKTTLPVSEAADKHDVLPGNIYVAPGDYHLLIEKDRTFSLDDSEKVNFSRPSIDITFEAAAAVYGERLACVLFSGANSDGAKGLQAVQRAGGLAVIQEPASADVSYMPAYALAHMKADAVLLPSEMATFINNLPA